MIPEQILYPSALMLRRRPRLSLGLSILLGLFPILAATFFLPATGSATAAAMRDNLTWVDHQGTRLTFTVPPAWSLETTPAEGDEEAYLLTPPGQSVRIRIATVPLQASIDGLRALERHLVHAVESDKGFQQVYLHIGAPFYASGSLYALVKYAATLDDGAQIRGMRAARLLPDQRLLIFDVTAQSIEALRLNQPVIREVLGSVARVTPTQASP